MHFIRHFNAWKYPELKEADKLLSFRKSSVKLTICVCIWWRGWQWRPDRWRRSRREQEMRTSGGYLRFMLLFFWKLERESNEVNILRERLVFYKDKENYFVFYCLLLSTSYIKDKIEKNGKEIRQSLGGYQFIIV